MYAFNQDRNPIVSKIKFAREGANVQRTHTQPGIGPHPVGMHTFNMLCMLRILWPDAPVRLVWAILEHDIPERVTGDTPHPAKVAGIMDRIKQTEYEEHLNTIVFGSDSIQDLDENEAKWLSGLDMLEFYCWVRDQLMMGNRMMQTKHAAVENYMAKYRHKYPEEIVDIYYALRSDTWDTMSDIGGE